MKITCIVEPGETVADACRFAQAVADKAEWPVEFQFNSVRCVAEPGGDPDMLTRLQQSAQYTTLVVRSDTDKIDIVEELNA